MLKRIRKAVVAGVGAGLTAAISIFATNPQFDQETISQAVGAAILALATVGYATFQVKNAPTVTR